MDDQTPKSNELTPAPKSPNAQPTSKPTPAPSSGLMDAVQNLVTGGASGAMKNAITPKNMNYYHEDDGK
jgi:hypothetical protein